MLCQDQNQEAYYCTPSDMCVCVCVGLVFYVSSLLTIDRHTVLARWMYSEGDRIGGFSIVYTTLHEDSDIRKSIRRVSAHAFWDGFDVCV